MGQPSEGLGRHGHGVDMLIKRVSDPTFDERRPDNRVVVRFQVNQQPDQTWIQTFKGHAASSVLRAANAVFRGYDVTLELTKPKNLAELSTALDCFIECANLGLRSWGGAERNTVAPVRRGLLGTVRPGRGVL
jgi:D-alanyl-D-alanine dipeptidase